MRKLYRTTIPQIQLVRNGVRSIKFDSRSNSFPIRKRSEMKYSGRGESNVRVSPSLFNSSSFPAALKNVNETQSPPFLPPCYKLEKEKSSSFPLFEMRAAYFSLSFSFFRVRKRRRRRQQLEKKKKTFFNPRGSLPPPYDPSPPSLLP